MIRWVLRKPMEFVLYRPKLASSFVRVLTLFPFIHRRLISFASAEGLITQSHAPVPRQPKEPANKPVLESLVQPVEAGSSSYSPSLDQLLPQRARPRGKNHELKSPLEEWFY
jgi:hypothetical protein